MNKKIIAGFVCGIVAFGICLPAAGCLNDRENTEIPVWDAKVELTDNGVKLNLSEVKDAEFYNIYYSPSRYGNYNIVSAQEELNFTHSDKFGYFRIDAVKDDNVISSELISYDLETFGENTYVYSPEDDYSKINADIDEKFEVLEAGQFSTERFGVLFKKGEYPDVKMREGYYTSVSGLGYSPLDVKLGYFNVNAQWFKGNATHNFWRSIENVTVNGDTQWAVSQATSFRRVNVLGSLKLDDGGWSSGGYISDSKISGDINSGGQQQWFTRNSTFKSYKNGGWSRVFVGCQGTVPSGSWPSCRSTVVDSAEAISEKPFLVFDENGYGVYIPELRKNASGVSWENGEKNGVTIPLGQFYVARADRDTADTINAALKDGKHLLFTPGIYKLDKPLIVEKAETVITGIGLATLTVTDKNTDTAMRVKDVDGVNISGLLFDAGKHSSTLLQVGEGKTSVSHSADNIILSDLFFRVGGAENKNTSVDVCIEINANDVICDHFWVWRADHSYGVGWTEGTYTDRDGNERVRYANRTKNGVVVNGDNVTAYALMVEHFHEYQTLWNGENGKTYFYQSEAPYDPVQEDWTDLGGNPGYASYKVADGVQTHHAYGVGVYGYPNGCVMTNGIESSNSEGVYFEHIFTVMLSGSKQSSVTNVINGVGGEVSNDKFDQTVEYYYGGEIQHKKQ